MEKNTKCFYLVKRGHTDVHMETYQVTTVESFHTLTIRYRLALHKHTRLRVKHSLQLLVTNYFPDFCSNLYYSNTVMTFNIILGPHSPDPPGRGL